MARYKSTAELLFQFLGQEGITRIFLYNLDRYNMHALVSKDNKEKVSSITHLSDVLFEEELESVFDKAFHWRSTPQDFSYWCDMEKRWLTFLKRFETREEEIGRLDSFLEEEEEEEESYGWLMLALQRDVDSLVKARDEASSSSIQVTGDMNHSFMTGYLSSRCTAIGEHLQGLMPVLKKIILKK